MGDLSSHFSRSEFRCHHCGRLGPDPALSRLVQRLEALRALVGHPLRIVSGYRCPVHNRAVGGATRSRHLAGDAADIPYAYATVSQAVSAGFDGIGRKGGFAVHVDCRGYPARWVY